MTPFDSCFEPLGPLNLMVNILTRICILAKKKKKQSHFINVEHPFLHWSCHNRVLPVDNVPLKSRCAFINISQQMMIQSQPTASNESKIQSDFPTQRILLEKSCHFFLTQEFHETKPYSISSIIILSH